MKKQPYPQIELAERLRSAMEQAGLNLADLARACNVTIQAVHDWRETGRIGKHHLVTISVMTKKPLEYFLAGLRRVAMVGFVALPYWDKLASCVLCQIASFHRGTRAEMLPFETS